MPFKNIIFDFGNVLFDIDMGRVEQHLRPAFGPHFEAARARLLENRVFDLYETGGLCTEEFVAAIRFAAAPEAAEPLTETQVLNAWNSIFIGLPRHRLDLLLRLRKTHKVFLLSNINDLHARWIDDYLHREHGLADFETRFFDGVYFSHLLRLRKPDLAIYEYVLADAELVPGECVFFDDLETNIEGARRAGIHGVWHPPGTEIAERFVFGEMLGIR